MQQISPMLQAQIAKQQQIDNTKQNDIAQQVDLTQKPDTFELSTKNNENKKGKILKIAAISAAIVAAATGGFIAAKKGLLGENLKNSANNLWSNITKVFKKTPVKSQTEVAVGDKPQNTVENIKKFISNGSEIEGVKLEKGKAVLADGSMFSGMMETVTKSGKKVAIDYENGLITKSAINDKLFKTYEAPTKNLDRVRGSLIKEFDESGNVIKQHYHFLHNNGKLSKSMSKNIELSSPEYYNVLEFSPNGKKIAEYETNRDFWLKKGKIFNEDGSIKKEFSSSGPNSMCDETTYLSDGTSKKKNNGRYELGGIDEQIATKELVGCSQLELCDKDGISTKCISYTPGTTGKKLEVKYGNDLDNTITVCDKAVDSMHKPEKYDNYIKDINNSRISINPENGKVTDKKGHTKEQLDKVAAILEDANTLAETEGMYGPNVKFGFGKIIEQLKDHASNL